MRGTPVKKSNSKAQKESSDEYESDWEEETDKEVEILDSIEVKM